MMTSAFKNSKYCRLRRHVSHKSSMNRYFMRISYIGSSFRGIQKTIVKSGPDSSPSLDPLTIQGLVEIGLQKFDPNNQIVVKISSRTDAGVHALENTLHIDLPEEYRLHPNTITIHLNRNFYHKNVPIRVIDTVQVPLTFHCRFNARSRTYLYRLAVAKKERHLKHIAQVPIEEIQRCYFIQNPDFDATKLAQLSQKFVGYHDFRTFMSLSKHNRIQDHPTFTLRHIQHIEVTRGASSLTTPFNNAIAEELYDYWNIVVRGRSFLYKQVRRVIGTLVSASLGQISERDVHEMLTIPSNKSWLSKVAVAPAYGLYLCKIEYDEADLKFPSREEK